MKLDVSLILKFRLHMDSSRSPIGETAPITSPTPSLGKNPRSGVSQYPAIMTTTAEPTMPPTSPSPYS